MFKSFIKLICKYTELNKRFCIQLGSFGKWIWVSLKKKLILRERWSHSISLSLVTKQSRANRECVLGKKEFPRSKQIHHYILSVSYLTISRVNHYCRDMKRVGVCVFSCPQGPVSSSTLRFSWARTDFTTRRAQLLKFFLLM